MEIDPDNVQGWLQRGRIFEQKGRDIDAASQYSQALAVRPDDYVALRSRSRVLLRLKQFRQGLADHETSIAVTPAADLAGSCNELAWNSLTAPPTERDPLKSLAYATRAVTLDPAERAYRNTLGIALNRNGRHREAVVELEKSLASAPREQIAFDLFFLASSYHHLGDIMRSRDCYEQAIRSHAAGQHTPKEVEELQAVRLEVESQLGDP